MTSEDPAPEIHQLHHGAPLANELENLGREQGDSLRVIEPESARETLLRDDACPVEHELLEVARG